MRPTRFMICAAVLSAITLTACSREGAPAEGAESELPTLDVTHWTDKTELFMEYPPLVAGTSALFAVHLTTLADFKAVTAGRASIEFTPEAGGSPTTLRGPEPSRPGVFRVEGTPPSAGQYTWTLSLEAPGLSDRHDLGTITVFADDAAARTYVEQQPAEDAAAIAYLKEPQWTTDFATAVVQEGDVRTSIRAPATIHPLPGGEAIVAAPAAGRFSAASLYSIGDRLDANQILGQIEPRLATGPDRATLAADVAEAQAAVEGARIEQGRAERLLADRAVPARRVEDAARAHTVAEARLRAAQARLAQRDETLRTGGGAAADNAFAIRAPIAGRLAEVMATLGASYDEGAPLFRVVRTDRVELVVHVPAADVPAARSASGLVLELPGVPTPVAVQPRHIHDAGIVDPITRALSLQMDVENPREQLLIGQVCTAVLYMRDRMRMPVVPNAAVLMEAGRPYVFVQLGGERFARRFIELGSRDGDLVGVKSGVAPGERVVTRGAYDVQLASAATGLPAEGHVH